LPAVGYYTRNVSLKFGEEEIKEELTLALKEIIEAQVGAIDVERLAKVSSDVRKLVSITHGLIVEKNYSKLLTTVKYAGKRELINFVLLESLPKSFAKNASKIKIKSQADVIEIVESDPKFLFIFKQVKPKETILVQYHVNETVEEGVIDEVETLVFVQDYKEQMINVLPIVVAILILIGLSYKFYDKIAALFEEKPKFRYRYPGKKRSVFDEIKERIREIRRKFKKREVKVKYI